MLTSNSDLVNIQKFQDTFRHLVNQDDDAGNEILFGLDESIFNTDDLLIVDPDEQIRVAIEREMKRTNHQEQQRQEELEMNSIREFHKSLEGIAQQQEDDEEEDETFTPGPSSSLPQQTPSEMAAALMLNADVPQYDDLVQQRPAHMKCLDESERYSSKNKREVNYFTPQMQQIDDSLPEDLVDPFEVILRVSFHHPQKSTKTQEYLVLGSQCLVELKDKFYCLSDAIFRDCTTTSGYFFIENTFYDDTRAHDSIEYSKDIINWVREKKRYTKPEFGLYTSKKMESTTFSNLSLRIGVPYLYCHRGNCEHLMIVNEVRIIHDGDNQNRNVYPLQTFQNKIRRKKCRVCDIYPAKYVTRGDPLAPENPCFFCEQCYHPLHYKSDTSLQYTNYEVYVYYHE